MLTGWNQPATDCPALFSLDVLIVLNYLLRLQAVPPKVSGMLELKPQINCPGSEGSWGFQIWIYPPAPFTPSVRHFSVIVSPVNTPCELFVVRTFVLHFACPQILWRYERFSAWSQNLWSRYRAVSVFHLPLLCTLFCFCAQCWSRNQGSPASRENRSTISQRVSLLKVWYCLMEYFLIFILYTIMILALMVPYTVTIGLQIDLTFGHDVLRAGVPDMVA